MCLRLSNPKSRVSATILINRATAYRTLPAVGRTHGQHASIIAFGLKFAVWAVEMAKHIERMEESKKRILRCKTLGVVGTGSLMGESALTVQELVAEKLGLAPIEAGYTSNPTRRIRRNAIFDCFIGFNS